MQTPYIIHGSHDSLDKDIFFIVPPYNSPTSIQDCKILCENLSTKHQANGNIVSVLDGVVVKAYKGTIDEVNNGMLSTYHLHDQVYQLPVIYRVPRHVEMKVLRTTRGILSMFSKTEMRTEIKHALRSESLQDKINVLDKIDFTKEYDFSGKGSIADIYKFFAFQLTQTVALTEGLELFTKKDCYEYDYNMGSFLYRKEWAYQYRHFLNGSKFNFLYILNEYKEKYDTLIKTNFGTISVKEEKYI
jgi:hypothetical protein